MPTLNMATVENVQDISHSVPYIAQNWYHHIIWGEGSLVNYSQRLTNLYRV